MPTSFTKFFLTQNAAPGPAPIVYIDTRTRKLASIQLKCESSIRMEVWGSIDATVRKLKKKTYCLVGGFSISDKEVTDIPEHIIAILRNRGYRFIKMKTISGTPPQVIAQTTF